MLSGFKLVLSSNVWQSKLKFSEVLSLNRKILSIEISNVVGCHEALVRLFHKFGPNLQSCSIKDSKIDDFTLREILRNADSLRTLTLSEVVVIKKLPAINPVSMRKLKNLTIYHCDWSIMKFITAQLKSLDVKSYLDEGASKSSFINFLAQQRLLKELSLRGTSARTLFQQDDIVVNSSFSLEKFQLDHDFGKNSDAVNWHLTAFLSLHVETLKNVEIIGPNCEHINGFAIANLTNLEVLAIDVRGLPKDLEFYEFMEREPNTQLKQLSLRGFFVHPQAIKRILLKFPAIEKLELNDWGNGNAVSDMLDFVSKNFPNLQQLSVTDISTSENIKFSALTNLSVTYIRNAGKLMQFIARNTSVETLKVGLIYIGQVTMNFVNEIKDLGNVKHVAFGGNKKALSNIFELMKKHETPESLKTLELSLISDEKLAMNSGKAKKFYFPIAKTTKFEVI